MLHLLALAAVLAQPFHDITFSRILTLPPTAPPVRAPFRPDPVQAALSDGSWITPTENAEFAGQQWRTLAAGDDHSFRSEVLAGGYAYATFESPADAIMLLEAAGHGMVYVNGVPRAGDPYDYGFLQLPIDVRKGENTLLFQAGRGHLALHVTPAAAPLILRTADATLPDLVEGAADPVIAGCVVINASHEWRQALVANISCQGVSSRTPLPPVPPMSIRKVPITLSPPAGMLASQEEIVFSIALREGEGPLLATAAVGLRIRTAAQTRKVTFISDIDGSVQYYALNPAAPAAAPTADHAPPRALVLSLHGASVEATSQADAYRAKPWCDIVCPTNRRPFGFDWEDWGRVDALEVLDLATAALKPDPQRIYLTGHSMGGHGTWSIGALCPDRFAAIAPSAGWISFWSYAGAQAYPNPTPLETIFRRAMAPSDTLAYARNYLHEGVYILHGDVDDNVPVTQAREMRKRLAEDHADFAYYERPGANHWWGNECVDWSPLFEFLQQHTRRADAATAHVEFTTPNVGVSSRCRWATILQPIIQNEPASIKIDYDREHHIFSGETTNVARLSLMPQGQVDAPAEFKLDGGTAVHSSKAGLVELELGESGWAVASVAKPAFTLKNPLRTGPFKRALGHKVILIYGTGGSDADRAWAFNKARFDAETFYYRGNGALDILPDTAFTGTSTKDRSIILYGNADTNRAWKDLLATAPIQAANHRISIAFPDHTDTMQGDDLTALFLFPRPNSDTALVGVIAPTGAVAQRACERTAYFSSGIAYPDWTVFSSGVLRDGLNGVRAAGFFDNAWRVDPAQTAMPLP